jgi:hypothetical protein
MSNTEMIYSFKIDPINIMEDVVSHFRSKFPDKCIDICEFQTFRGLPRNDYGVTIKVDYEIKENSGKGFEIYFLH